MKLLSKIEKPWWFDRRVLLFSVILWGSFLLILAKLLEEPGLFSGFGALLTVCGLFLNIKHTMAFHLKVPLRNKYYVKLGRGFGFAPEYGESEKKKTIEFLSDEVFGVFFMIFGAIISAYGNYLI